MLILLAQLLFNPAYALSMAKPNDVLLESHMASTTQTVKKELIETSSICTNSKLIIIKHFKETMHVYPVHLYLDPILGEMEKIDDSHPLEEFSLESTQEIKTLTSCRI
jgi:hypothetical protein